MLAEPIGCEDAPTWLCYGNKTSIGRLGISDRDFARIGLLYLNGGRWAGKQLISEEHVKLVTSDPLPLALPRAGEGGTRGAAAEIIPGIGSLGSTRQPDNQTPHNGSYSWTWWTNSEQKTGQLFRPTAPADLYGAFGNGRYGPSTMSVLPTQEMVVSWNHAGWKAWNVSNENEAFGLLMEAVDGLETALPVVTNHKPSEVSARPVGTLRAVGASLRSTGSTGYALSVGTSYMQPIISSVAGSARASVVRVGTSYHMIIAEVSKTGSSLGHYKGTANATVPWTRVETISANNTCDAASLYWNSDQTRWELLVRRVTGSWHRMYSRTAGFTGLSSGDGWAGTDGSMLLNASGAASDPFYDANEGHWHRLISTSARLELASANHIAGPYSRTPETVALPTWAVPGGGAAACPWSGDATHFAVFPATNGSRFGFCFSWDAVAWPSAPPQQVELPVSGWTRRVLSIHAMAEDPHKRGTFSVFFTGEDASGNHGVGVMQV